MDTKHKTSNWIAIVTTLLVLSSLLLNVIQYRSARKDKISENYDCNAFFAKANDQTLIQLYLPGQTLKDPSMKRVFNLGRAESEVDKRIREYVAEISAAKEGFLRKKPTCSFLVIFNTGNKDLDNVTAVINGGREDEIILQTSTLLTNEYILFPIDFRMPGNDAISPKIPNEVTIKYSGGEKLKKSGHDMVSWLEGQFIRASVRPKKSN